MTATKAGDVATVLSLMTDDVVFLTPGGPVMRKGDFAAAAGAQSGAEATTFEGTSDIQEIDGDRGLGLHVDEAHRRRDARDRRSGDDAQGAHAHVLRKENGRWLLARDANLLGPPTQMSDAREMARAKRRAATAAEVPWKLPLRRGPVRDRDRYPGADHVRLLDLPAQERAHGQGPREPLRAAVRR